MFTGVYIKFLIFAQNIDYGYSLEPPLRLSEAVLTSTHNLCFEQKYKKVRFFFTLKFSFLVVKFSMYLNRHVFIMWSILSTCLTAVPQLLKNKKWSGRLRGMKYTFTSSKWLAQILYVITVGARLICTLDDLLHSYSKQPPKLYCFVIVFYRIVRIIQFDQFWHQTMQKLKLFIMGTIFVPSRYSTPRECSEDNLTVAATTLTG